MTDELPHREHIADDASARALARAELMTRLANNCSCGVRVDACPTHRNELEEEA